MTEQELFDRMFERKCVSTMPRSGERPVYPKELIGYATLAKDFKGITHVYEVEARNYVQKDVHWKAGTKVRVNVVSRFGDFGFTNDLSQENGYKCRGINPGEGYLIDIRCEEI